MLRRSLFVFCLLGLSSLSLDAFAAPGRNVTIAQINCNGTAVIRTEVGQLEVITVPVNMEGCVGPRASSGSQVTNTNADQVVNIDTGSIISSTESSGSENTKTSKFNPANGPLLDLACTQIGKYRIEAMKEQGIRYTNPVRSVRLRAKAIKKSTTEAYLMKNNAVVVSQPGTGWTKAQGADVKVLDTRENIVAPATYGKAKGYVATRFLRDPNPSDLVRIGQADQAYWSDVAHVKVAHLVNVRANPWYGTKIKNVLSDSTPLYVVSTVDNWSEVMSDDRTIHGYIRSDFLVITKAQRVELKPLMK